MKNIIPDGYKTANITKAKLSKTGGIEAELTALYLLENDKGDITRCNNTYAVSSDLPPHIDLVNAFRRLLPHMLLLIEIDNSRTPEDIDLSKYHQYTVTGFTLGGSDGHPGITIIGRKLLAGGKILNIITPFTKFEGGENEVFYEFGYQLYSEVDDLTKELLAYFAGKSNNVQLELFVEEAA